MNPLLYLFKSKGYRLNLFVLIVIIFHYKPGFSQSWVLVNTPFYGANPYDGGAGVGISLSNDGSTVAISFPNHSSNGFQGNGLIQVYKNIAGTWVQQGNDITGIGDAQVLGTKISLSGDGTTLAAFGYNVSFTDPYIKIFKLVNNNWVDQGTFVGKSVSLSENGNIVVIGYGNFSPSGIVKVFQFSNNQWVQVGQTIPGETSGEGWGWEVDINNDGTIITAVSPFNHDAGQGAGPGQVRIYQLVSGNWIQMGTDINQEQNSADGLDDVSLSGDGLTLAIGAHYPSGQVKVYKYMNGNWTQMGSTVHARVPGDWFGYDVALSNDGQTFVAGAIYHDEYGHDAGEVTVFRWDGTDWTQLGPDINEDSSNYSIANNQFGYFVDINQDGNIIAATAPFADHPSGLNCGRAYVYAYTNTNVIDDNNFSSFVIMPNPAGPFAYISFDIKGEKTVRIFDMTGKKVWEQTTGAGFVEIPVSHWKKGVYVVRIETGDRAYNGKLSVK